MECFPLVHLSFIVFIKSTFPSFLQLATVCCLSLSLAVKTTKANTRHPPTISNPAKHMHLLQDLFFSLSLSLSLKLRRILLDSVGRISRKYQYHTLITAAKRDVITPKTIHNSCVVILFHRVSFKYKK